MSFCHECGHRMSQGAAFCDECGTRVEGPVEAEQPTPFWADVTPEPMAYAEHRPPRTSWWRRRRVTLLGRGFLLLGLVGSGLVGGWFLGSDRSLVEVEAPARAATPVDVEKRASEPVMPDVRGLDTADARQILADAGVEATEVVVTDQPAAGESGIVLGQDPVFGYPADSTVELSVAAPAKVPGFAGRTAQSVLDELDSLGAEVTTTSQYVPGVAAGQVARISPAPGTLLPVAVTVLIGAPPEEIALADLDTLDYSCSTDRESMGGTVYPHLLLCDFSPRQGSETWIVGRAANRVAGVLGLPDSYAEPGDSVTLEVVGDGVVRQSVVATYGTPTRFDVDVQGVLRLQLRYRTEGTKYSSIGLGRLRLLGDPEALRRLGR